MSNQTTPITDDEIRSVLYRMAAHVSFFAEPRTADPKAAAFADVLMSTVRLPNPEPPPDARGRLVVTFTELEFIAVASRVNDLVRLLSATSHVSIAHCKAIADELFEAILKRTVTITTHP